ncbi:MAG: RidA family protein [Burkholderiales bacterium]|jgi:2-iminobutanoate/2-iminopropanoate deaminase|nr:RidA family protein [Burkholderiales bacterium]
MKLALRSDKLYTPRFHYSPAVRTGPWVTLSGMIAIDPAVGKIVPGGPGAEAAHILALMQAAIADWGFTLAEITAARIYTTRMDRFAEINAAWEATFRDVVPPARTSIGVAALPLDATVEIEFQLYHPE